MKNILAFFVQRTLIVNLISIFIILLGIYAMLTINREAFPNVNLDNIAIGFSYPGASPEEIEQLIITPIEQELKSLDGINKMTSVAFPSSGNINLEVAANSINRARMISDVQLAIDQAKLPLDLPYDPVVTEIDGRIFPIIQLAIAAPLSKLDLKRLGDKIKDDLLNIKGVAKVRLQGDRKAELSIIVDPKKLHQQRISITEIESLLQSWNINAPGGELDTRDGQKTLRIVGQFSSPEDAANLIIRANEYGAGVRLGDVATVKESLVKASLYYEVNAKPAMAILVMKKVDADIITTVNRVKDYIKSIPDTYGKDIKVSTFRDFSKNTKLRLSVLSTNAIVGLFLVFICLVAFLRPSVALTTTIGLPIVFFIGLYTLSVMGITLNLVSMLGFIMVLGMLVDDAIIVGENITYHMEQNMPPLKAAVVGSYELMGPVITTILTTIAAFIPMLFMSGILGKFIVSIPIVVIMLLIFSLLESFLILPSHVAHFARPKVKFVERKWLVAMESIYARVLEKSIRYRKSTVFLSVIILVLAVAFALMTMKFELFPEEGIEEFFVQVAAEPGTNLEEMKSTLNKLSGDITERVDQKKIDMILITTGKTSTDQGDPLSQRGSRFGQLQVVYIASILRPQHNAANEMVSIIDELTKHYPQLTISLQKKKPGPPSGRALQVEITGTNRESIVNVATRLQSYVKAIKGVLTVESDLQRGDNELRIILDRKKATYAGVNLLTVSKNIRAIGSGLRVSTIRRGTKEVDVTIRFPNSKENNIEYLRSIEIPNNRGGLIPLGKIAKIIEQPALSTIRHAEGSQVIRVVANIDTAIIKSNELNRLVKKNEQQWLGSSTSRVSIHYGGEQEKNQESIRDLVIAFGFALIGIFFILAIQFNNVGYPLAVMLAIPFGAVGIIISFYLHDLFWKPLPLSFFSLMGMVALTGVVVNSSMILLVFVQRALKEGITAKDAIILAGRRRLRAVVLTALTTVVGLLPTAYGWGGMDPFVSPMALSLSWGLIFATFVTLITIPAVMAIAFGVKN
ncbi:hypothetical protein MNBD_GAMMA23-1032 [hydrothermal vent metagenome]|uniref:Acriflavin resistance protein n=1 Tax=hydrothermal vent metagenome TaxID=652676 RepID=A0A3B0ZDL7_9ZZZZ